MTLYSCLPTGAGKFAIIATWSGEYAESHSAKVTTFTDAFQASRVADVLTRVSESMWDAAAWLDIYEAAEARVATIVHAARGTSDIPSTSKSFLEDCRNEESWTGIDLAQTLSAGLADTLNTLSRAQRLSVADELAIDAAARTAALQLLPTGYDPGDATSRIWQAANITCVTKMGLTGHLPDGAAGWMVRFFDTGHGPAERWGARDMLHRLEQLEAAAKTIGGRGGAEFDQFDAPRDHLVLPAKLFGVHRNNVEPRAATVGDDIDPLVASSALADAYRDYARTAEWVSGDAVLYIGPDIDVRRVAPWDRDVFAKLKIEASLEQGKVTLATLEPTDTAGFVAALGHWVTNVPFRS